MAGRTPNEAVKAFAKPIQTALTCFADGRVQVDSYDPGVEGVLQFNGAEPVRLRGASRVHLQVAMRYCIINNDEAQKPWKVHTIGWAYSLLNSDKELVVDFHWHLRSRQTSHFPTFTSTPKR